MLARLKRWAAELRAQVVTLWFCRRHPDTPLSAKILAAVVVAYAFSPIDLIPDFIPVLGYLDDLILVPLGIYLTLWLIPPPVLAQARRERMHGSRRSRQDPGATGPPPLSSLCGSRSPTGPGPW